MTVCERRGGSWRDTGQGKRGEAKRFGLWVWQVEYNGLGGGRKLGFYGRGGKVKAEEVRAQRPIQRWEILLGILPSPRRSPQINRFLWKTEHTLSFIQGPVFKD